jgi:hypothetical protein
MNKLVLATLLASAACTATVTPIDPPVDPPIDTSAVITAHWQFDHFADGSSRDCPTNYQTASIYSQPWDPISGRLTGQPIIDKFNCVDMRGTSDPLDGIYLVWVQIESDNGQQIYAKSAQSYVDTADGDATVDFKILDDAGFFYL